MTSVDSQIIEAGDGATGSASSQIAIGGWLRVAFGVLAVLALATWGAFEAEPSTDRSRLQVTDQPAETGAHPLYDGRGKWRGY